MRSKRLVGPTFLAVMAGFLLVTNPMVAEAAIKRCQVTALEPRLATPTETTAGIEGFMVCDPAILPERFNNTVCLQVKKGTRFVDVDCCRIRKTRVGSTPWTMCAEDKRLLSGTHKYRTRATAVRVANGTRETDYSPTFKITLQS